MPRSNVLLNPSLHFKQCVASLNQHRYQARREQEVITLIKSSHDQRSSELISYYKHCYREDSSDLSLFNIDKLRADRLIVIDDVDVLASGELTYQVLVDSAVSARRVASKNNKADKKTQSTAQKIQHQADLYRKERMLIYGCLMIKGSLNNQSGLLKTSKVHAPLLYFPAKVDLKDDEHVATIINDDLRINVSLLRQVLKPDIEASIIDTFPVIKYSITKSTVSKIDDWLQTNTIVTNTEQLVWWPRSKPNATETPLDTMTIDTVCCVALVDRARGKRYIPTFNSTPYML